MARNRRPRLAPAEPAHTIVVQAQIAGLPLEVVEGEWVTLRSLFEPFGKDVSKQIGRLETWANVEKMLIRPRSGSTDPRAKEAWCIDRRHVAQAIAELGPRECSRSQWASENWPGWWDAARSTCPQCSLVGERYLVTLLQDKMKKGARVGARSLGAS